ncbi:MAG: NAD(P)/FAD-dependent oxidoreductase [Actinobacteria bacterium]|jgi:cation diffusion facilitator CzcD-associated flavoprotein CzcO|nr:NAD(P)/FAD-dependent oxidoreductase [Actinomycetota bacterium]MBT3687266.1 NAD(P)/FAD-dependent oxidoreductase [Actinomycetota bacterium]MBT4038001.1 NAD(P)/FAD-dependent oxidoreductase [Actinomycetota bacterium]MBT4279978.1 NAD(P)/FAD-dependent oxidoreductase [Actinomycetota bacterium]MBT4342852.1 NAD(P)/FAD-dependent oxidoreductase [Actinomycetota bacterium]
MGDAGTVSDNGSEHFDVLIVGAGISGVGGAYHLSQQCPDKTFVMIETMDGFGGTWKTHTYPGIRSDSDLYTFGYRFKPWTGPPIATADEILTYMGEVIDDNDLDRHIRYNHTITAATWSTDNRRWTLEVTRTDTGEQATFTGDFLWMCQGYYRHSRGYTPEWEGMDRFEGQIVHPQTWPDDLDYTDKQVVVIGSGATAATLIPAMADECGHVTMLQRSPTFFVARPNSNEMADTLRELDIPEEWTHEIVRRKILHDQAAVIELSFEYPDMVREELYKGIRDILGEDFDVSPHFTPAYRPWQQRLALIPDGDLFHTIAAGDASVVTDEIVEFTETGIQLKSGDHLEADIIITATGFELSVLGDIEFSIDGEPLVFSDTVGYRGMMFTGVPNMAWIFGYFRASWTLRADLIADLVCRLLKHMDELGASVATPVLRDEDADMELLPWLDSENFNPGYLMRAMHLLPSQGSNEPWRHTQDYWADREALPVADLDDGALVYD